MNSTEVSKKVNEVIECFEHKDRVKRVGVFGSVARGEATAESDVDLVIDFMYDEYIESDPLFAIRKKYIFESVLRDAFVPISVDIVDTDALNSKSNAILSEEVGRDVIWLYDAAQTYSQ